MRVWSWSTNYGLSFCIGVSSDFSPVSYSICVHASLRINPHSVAFFNKHRYLDLNSCFKHHCFGCPLGRVAFGCRVSLGYFQVHFNRHFEANDELVEKHGVYQDIRLKKPSGWTNYLLWQFETL